MKKNRFIWLVALVMSLFLLTACGQAADQDEQNTLLKLATTTSTEDSGLLDVLLPEFTADTGFEVDVIAVGTGQAIVLGENGDVDVILVHARAAEDAFVAGGHGVDRKDVMYNDFLIIGPANDPAGIKGETNVITALQKIAQTESVFVSRGDNSGTHIMEQNLWNEVGIEPQGEWYREVGQGMGETFRMADEMVAYTLIDRATYLFNRDNYTLEPAAEGDERLFNPYGVIAVNPDKYDHVNYDGAVAFIEWLVYDKAQKMIEVYGVDELGQALFVPNAE